MTCWVFSRFRPIRLIVGLGIVWLGLGLALPAFGQRAPRRPPAADKLTAMPAKLEGTVVSVNEKSSEIVISAHVPPPKDAKDAPEDTKWTVTMVANATIRVVGDAKPDYLKAGYTVQFTAKIDEAEAGEKTVEIKDKIQELKIITPTRPARGTAPAHKKTGKSEGEGAASKPAEPQAMVGVLGRLHEHKWPVRVGGKMLQIQLADDVKIHVELTGPSARRLISAGDTIAVEGQIIRNNPGPCWASDVQVTLARPLTGPKKGKRAGGK